MPLGVAGLLIVGGLLVWLYVSSMNPVEVFVIVTRDVTATPFPEMEIPGDVASVRQPTLTLELLTGPEHYTWSGGTELFGE